MVGVVNALFKILRVFIHSVMHAKNSVLVPSTGPTNSAAGWAGDGIFSVYSASPGGRGCSLGEGWGKTFFQKQRNTYICTAIF